MAAEDGEFVFLNASDVEGLNETITPLPIEEIDALQEWLGPTDYSAASSEYGKHRASHLAGTGLWLQQTVEYRQWHDGDAGALWIKAVAGAGKSVVAASLTSQLITNEKVPVLYFFFRQIVSANQKPISLVRDYLSQLLPYSPQLQHDLSHYRRRQPSLNSTTSFGDLWKLFVSASLAFSRIYCVVDALDEMDPGNESFLETLVVLGQKNPTAIKLLMTSRPVSRIEQSLQHGSVLQIVLQPKFVSPDIFFYVKHRTNEFSVSDDVRPRIHQVMSAKADGHFLYARLMMDDLLKTFEAFHRSEEHLLLALEKLPTPMADMYTKMLNDHSKRSLVPRNLQVTLLQWVTRAIRPLRLLELASLVDTKELTPEIFKGSKSVVREGCGPLLEILEDGTVCPIHHSFTEYLYDSARPHAEKLENQFPVLQLGETHRTLALACIRFLRSGWHLDWEFSQNERGWCSTDKKGQPQRFRLKYPFLGYAARNWYKHLRKSGAKDEEINLEVYALLVTDTNLLRAWLELTEFSTESDLRVLPADFRDYTPLRVAADKGLHHVIKYLVEQGHDVDWADSTQRTAMTFAAASGHANTVKALIELEAKINKADDQGLTPLHQAAKGNHHACVSILIEAGVDPFTPRTEGNPEIHRFQPITAGTVPLQYACRNGHLETVKVYLPYLKDDYVYQALRWVWTHSPSKVAPTLLRMPNLDVNHVYDDQTLLYLASCVADVKSMKILLDSGADVSIFSGDHYLCLDKVVPGTKRQNALHGMLHRSTYGLGRYNLETFEAGLELLLGAGVDINAVDSNGMTILHYLLHNGTSRIRKSEERESVLFMLLEKGSDASVVTQSGQNVLHFVSSWFSETIIDALITHGASIDHLDHKRQSPLIKALSSSNPSIAQVLIKKGADPNLPDRLGNAPLHIVVGRIKYTAKGRKSDLELAKSLISAGADVNARNRDGNTPLHLQVLQRAMLNLLLEHGIDLEAKNRHGRTALFCHSGKDEPTFYKMLIDAGADPCSRDSEGRTVLHNILSSHCYAPHERVIEKLKYFVAKGVDPHATDKFGDNLWHTLLWQCAISYPNHIVPVMKYLTDIGVSATSPNYAGRLPLHYAFMMSADPLHNSVIEFLFDKVSSDIDVMDHNGIRPIHLACSRHTEFTARLLSLGAESSAATLDGQTPLMIASRLRQSNTLCLLLDWYQEHDMLSVVNDVDTTGQSALHYACRSGRPEAVAMLLDAGANVNLEDQHGLTPLGECAGYLEEQALWNSSRGTSIRDRESEFASILIGDQRPKWSSIQDDFPRIREVIRLLVARGANIELPVQKYANRSTRRSPLDVAIDKRCQAVVQELLNLKQRTQSPQPISDFANHEMEPRLWRADLSKFKDRAKFLGMVNLSGITVEDLGSVGDRLNLVKDLLREDNEPAIKQLHKLGVDFMELNEKNETAIEFMVQWGFTDLVRCVGRDAAKMTAAWAATKSEGHRTKMESILAIALKRQMPNLEMIKSLVSEHHIDVNEKCSCMKIESTICQPVIHKIARLSQWWNIKALEYLVTQVRDIDMIDCRGETALMVVLSGKVYSLNNGKMRYRAAKLLLQHGANPNAMDTKGLTCLNHAAGHQDCFELLLEHGADPFLGYRPVLFDLVESQNIRGLRRVIAAGIDVNKRCEDLKDDASRETSSDYRPNFPKLDRSVSEIKVSHVPSIGVLMENAYAIHLAAAHVFNKEHNFLRIKAVGIIELLLKSGANPFLSYNSGISILHTLAEQAGILKPFLKHKDLDLESKDHLGRTLLLAACDCWAARFGVKSTTTPLLLIEHGSSIEATDDKGRNALHCLISAERQDNDHPPAILSMPDVFFTTLVSKVDHQGRNAFHYALSDKRYECIDKLLASGADPSVSDPLDGCTALHHIAPGLNDYREIVLWNPNLRLSSKGDVSPPPDDDDDDDDDEKEKQDSTSSSSSSLSDVKRRNLLLRKNAKISQLYPNMVKIQEAELRSPWRHFNNLLTNHGLSINARDDAGDTPLLKFAAANPQEQDWASAKVSLLRIFKMFDEAGADFTVRNKEGESVLHKLAMHKNYRGVKTTKGTKILDEASKDLQDCASWLLKKGVKVSWEDTSSRTCLDIAAVAKAQWLLEIYTRE